MPYIELYRKRQHDGAETLDLQWYVNDALELTWVGSVDIFRTPSLSLEALRGYIIKGANVLFPQFIDLSNSSVGG